MSCIFNINDLDNSLEQLGKSLYDRLQGVPDCGLINVEDIKQEILRRVTEVSESSQINPENVDSAFQVFDDESLFWDIEEYVSDKENSEKAMPSKEELREAMISWQKPQEKESEDTSTGRLESTSKNIKRIKDDPLAFAYGRALKAKIRAKQHANTVGVHSILYNEDGIINSVEDLNYSIVNQQEKLLRNILNYLETFGIHINKKLYDNGNYTGIMEELNSKYDKFFKFDFNELNNLYNTGQFEILDAISSWVILNNFDTVLKQTFGKALNIDPDKSKYSSDKYSIAGGSNVYTTWRVNEDIDLAKEINNISQAIITSIPYYTAKSTSPGEDRNLKFNEFIYLISKIKDIPHYLKKNYIFNIGDEINISDKAKEFLNGKSLSSVINTLRDNPQESIPLILEAFNNDILFEDISSSLEYNYFASVDRDLINTVYQGLFNLENPDSLYSIQTKSGFDKNNYYAFISQTIDSVFKSGFLQYFRNPEGEIYVRKMYDQSIYRIEQGIKSDINNFNSLISLDNYEVQDDVQDVYSTISPTINRFEINNQTYEVQVLQNQNEKIIRFTDSNGQDITNQSILEQLNLLMKAKYGKPSIVSFTYNSYHKGPLKVEVNLINGKINYSINGVNEKFLTRKDFESLLPLIDDILKQNFGLDADYLGAYLNRISGGIENVSSYPEASNQLMQLVSRVIANKYLQENYIKYLPVNSRRNKIDSIFTNGGSYKPTYNKRLNELNYLTDAETRIINNLAEAKALVTGRLTSSQILDGEGNALASSALSRLVNSLDYQVEVQVKQPDSASKEFTLWKEGVYKGVFQLKEMRDNSNNTSKPHTKFSNKELENSLVFIDFVSGLVNIHSTKTPYTDGVVGFYSSENSDKTYAGRMLVDLQAIKVGESTLYNLLRENPENISKFIPTIRKELGQFYYKALENINKEWSKIGQQLGINISYGNWEELEQLVDTYNYENRKNLTTVEYLKQFVTEYNFNNPFNPITLIENVHYVDNKGTLIRNDSFVANLLRFDPNSDVSFMSFMQNQEIEILQNLLKDGVSVDATPEIRKLIGDQWIDNKTNKVILAKYYDPIDGDYVGDIRRAKDLDSGVSNIILNPLLTAYNYLNYFFTQEYMNSSVGAYYAHPNKKGVDTLSSYRKKEINWEKALSQFLEDEKVRKLAQDKRNVSFTASMHSMLKNLIQGIPDEINVAVMPDVHDQFETISGDIEDGLKPYDGATYTNPFYQILQNNSLGGSKVGVIKKTFTHYYDEKTGTGGIIKTAEFPLTNEYIRRSKFYKIMMENMTNRVWRDQNGNPCTVDITTDYEGNTIVFNNPNSDQGYMYYQDDVTGNYYMFNIIKGDAPNTYIRNSQRVDQNGLPTQDEPISETWEVNTNYDLWRMFGGERSMSFNKGKFHQSEHSITQVVNIMNRTTIAGVKLNNVKTQQDVWQPLKHSDIHLMPTTGAVKQGAANVNSVDSYKTADSSKINHFRIKTNQVGVQLDKEHQADGEDLSIMTQVLSACAARGYTQEMTQNLYNAMAKLAEAGIRPYLDNFKQFFKISERPNATPQQLEEARVRFENTLLETLVKALANSTNTSSTLQIITQELLEKAKEGKDIDFARLNIPLSDPAVMKKLHSTISVALTNAAIKIKVDGNLNILCPSYGIVKVYNGKMYEDYLNDQEISNEQALQDENPQNNLINTPYKLKLGRTYKLTKKDGTVELKTLKVYEDYYQLRESLNKYTSIREQFAPYFKSVVKAPESPSPQEVRIELEKYKDFNKKVQVLKQYGVDVNTDLEPQTIEEYVYSNLPLLQPEDIRKETGYKHADFQSFLGILAKKEKGGLTVTQAAHELWEELPDYLGEYTDHDIRNIIIGAFKEAKKTSDITKYIENNRIEQALKEYEDLYDDEAEELQRNPEIINFEGGRELASYNVVFSGTIQPLNQSSIIVTGNPATTRQVAQKIGGIDVLRHPDANGMHFGNPFTHLEKEVQAKRASVLLPTVRESSQAFEQWLDGTAYQDVEPERRQWILNQINSGVLFGKPLVYYTTTIKDSEGTHYYNPETFPNHAQILQKKINQKQKELAGPLFSGIQQVSRSFNLYDLVSVRNLHDLKQSIKRGEPHTKEELDQALSDLQKDLSTLHSKHGQVLTNLGTVELDPDSIEIEPYEIVLPKIFATVFGLTEEDNLNEIKKDPKFFLKRLLQNLKPQHSDYTICFQRVNGKHIYVLNSDDAVQTQYFKPKEIQKTRENNKLYRWQNDEILYELSENDQVWERINPDGTTTEVIITDNPLDYLNRVDFITLNLNRNNSEDYNKSIIDNLRQSKNKNVERYIEAFDYVMTREGETFDNALEDIQEVDLSNYDDSPVGKLYEQLGNEIYASFLKSLEIVAARIPAQSMQSFMPMKVVGFEKSDRNTAYVSTAQFLFQGSDLDIDAVSLASYAFDKSGRYIIHSPLANISSYELLKASENLPFPTGKDLEINDDYEFDYSYLFEKGGPFVLERGNKVRINNNSPEAIEMLSDFIDWCNKKGYIPSASDPSLSLAVNSIRVFINRHNNYINTSKDVEKFSKNYVVSTMYNIGISPANLIESQQALDSITGPLKEVAKLTLKALQQKSSDNPADYTTNIRGFVQNMDGKTGVGICAVGLKGFFAATARYNEVLNNGTPEEIERLKSNVFIAGKRFRIIANAYTTNETSQAILGEIITQLDQGKDAALILSALLSLATDNAKELALSKLNAANMLGMYIYGISIGMDFKDISKIIASKTGQVIDSLMKDDVIIGQRGMSIENIFDYLELGPKIEYSEKISQTIKANYDTILNQKTLRDLAWQRAYYIQQKGSNEVKLEYLKEDETIDEVRKNNPSANILTGIDLIAFYESKKLSGSPQNFYYNGIIEYNRNIEKAQEYLQQIYDIITDSASFENYNLFYNRNNVNSGIYGDLKKLYNGGEEMRRLGQLLHINQGNESSYAQALSYIDKVESAISSAQYRNYREYSRRQKLKGIKKPKDYSKQYELNFHKFINNYYYREGCIDLYSGICKKDLFNSQQDYREIFIQALNPTGKTLEEQYNIISERIKISPSKTFFNILDILNVPHYFQYLRSADILHQYMQNSIKYRALYELGKTAIKEIGAYSEKDRESVFRRTEQFIDRILRDRFFISKEITFEIPVGTDFFVREENSIKRQSCKNSPAIIKLGTREGNASFKLLMEETIIPELKKMDRFKSNKFIQSLGTVLFQFNPEQQTTKCIAPNINMSPRSDTDSALFEEVKHDFNNLRTTDYYYLSGGIKHSLIDLFYYYNLIAFGGKVGENTLSNIFQDVLDFGNIKGFREYESFQDKHGELTLNQPGIKGTISLKTLIRETAPRATASSTKLNYFYNEIWSTGELGFYSRNADQYYTDPDTGEQRRGSKYVGSSIDFINDENSKDFLVNSADSDIVQINFSLASGQKVKLIMEKGSITDINVDGVSIEIPIEDKSFFRNLKTISKITPEGILEKYYNKNQIISKIEEIISCKL